MKKYALISLLVILLTIYSSVVQVYGQDNSNVSDQNPTIQLFNGHNLDGKIVVDNDRHIKSKTDKGSIFLSKGKHKLEVFYYENTGTESLKVELEGPGIEKQSFPLEIIFLEK
jgi:hypothetical protein